MDGPGLILPRRNVWEGKRNPVAKPGSRRSNDLENFANALVPQENPFERGGSGHYRRKECGRPPWTTATPLSLTGQLGSISSAGARTFKWFDIHPAGR